MKKYKLLKDLPTFKAGQMFVLLAEQEKETRNALAETIYWRAGLYKLKNNGDIDVMAYAQKTLDKFPNILKSGEWFEEIKEDKPWRPSEEEYYYIAPAGEIFQDTYLGSESDENCISIGNCFRTKGDAERAVGKLKALKRLRDYGLRFNGWEWNDGCDGVVIKARFPFNVHEALEHSKMFEKLFGKEMQ